MTLARPTTIVLVLCAFALLVQTGCDSGADPDAGPPDAGARDAGGADDAGRPEDAGAELDGGRSDGDAGTDDAGTDDAGTDDAGTDDAGTDDAGTDDAGGGTDAGSSDAGADAGSPDAGSSTCSPSLSPTGASIPDLVISEIDPGSFIEVFNTTGADIALGTGSYQFCSPFSYVALATLGAGVVVPAGGYAQLTWPAAFSDTDAGGEIILYADGSFGSASSMMDFVCWGTNPHGSRKALADSSGRWSGACAGAISGGSALARLPSNGGTEASHYDTGATPTPETCAP